MWLSFSSDEPAALQVGVGKVCAVSGEGWQDHLIAAPQNYCALPQQPWLDGINAGKGFIRQFVAMPLGLGATVEGQVTGEERHGGVQLRAVGVTPKLLKEWREQPRREDVVCCASAPLGGIPVMGLGAGGKMRQGIYADERPLSAYDEDRSWRVFVHLCSAAQWTAITGKVRPPTPVNRDAYVAAGLPWFDYYDADRDDLAASPTLAKVRPTLEFVGGDGPFVPVDPAAMVGLKDAGGEAVGSGIW